jgi:molybdopterin synthase sulfur carrier subunit
MSTSKTLTVRYFASIREAVGTGQETLQTQADTLGGLRDELIARGGPWAASLARGRAVRMALDQVMAGDDAPLAAVFPPVTGG